MSAAMTTRIRNEKNALGIWNPLVRVLAESWKCRKCFDARGYSAFGWNVGWNRAGSVRINPKLPNGKVVV
jgi:hypothetical protein